MSYNLTIGTHSESQFLSAGAVIAREVVGNNINRVSTHLNATLYNGGPSAPRSIKQLFSIENPSSTPLIYKRNPLLQDGRKDNRKFYILVDIKKKKSFSAVLGILEGIPVLGSVLALIGMIGHLWGMKMSSNRLKIASQELLQAKQEANTPEAFESTNGITAEQAAIRTMLKSKKIPEKTKEVFKAAIEYTEHSNYFDASLLSVIPMVKPITRLFQLSDYNPQPPHCPSTPHLDHDPREQIVVRPREERVSKVRQLTSANVMKIQGSFTSGALKEKPTDRVKIN